MYQPPVDVVEAAAVVGCAGGGGGVGVLRIEEGTRKKSEVPPLPLAGTFGCGGAGCGMGCCDGGGPWYGRCCGGVGSWEYENCENCCGIGGGCCGCGIITLVGGCCIGIAGGCS